jgi:hypothetical protein
MTDHATRILRRRQDAIVSLVTRRTIHEAARAAIGTETLCRWKKRPEFAAAYQQARARLQQPSGAVPTALTGNPDAPSGSRPQEIPRQQLHRTPGSGVSVA